MYDDFMEITIETEDDMRFIDYIYYEAFPEKENEDGK